MDCASSGPCGNTPGPTRGKLRFYCNRAIPVLALLPFCSRREHRREVLALFNGEPPSNVSSLCRYVVRKLDREQRFFPPFPRMTCCVNSRWCSSPVSWISDSQICSRMWVIQPVQRISIFFLPSLFLFLFSCLLDCLSSEPLAMGRCWHVETPQYFPWRD